MKKWLSTPGLKATPRLSGSGSCADDRALLSLLKTAALQACPPYKV